MARLSITLPDDLYEQIKRIALTSNVSAASAVRTILSDVVPRMNSVIQYLGTSPEVTQTDVDEADLWLRDLKTLYDRAPATYRDAVGDAPFDPPPTPGGHD